MVGGLFSGLAICWLTGELRLRAQLDRCCSLSYWFAADTSNGVWPKRHENGIYMPVACMQYTHHRRPLLFAGCTVGQKLRDDKNWGPQTDVFHCSSPLDGNQQRSVADLPVTVSSSEAQRILIQKSLSQQVLVVVSPAGLHLRATVSLLPQRLARRQNDIHQLDQAP